MYFLFINVYLPVMVILLIVGVGWLGIGQMFIHDAYTGDRSKVRRKVNMASSSIMALAFIWPIGLPIIIAAWIIYGVSLAFKTYVKKEFA